MYNNYCFQDDVCFTNFISMQQDKVIVELDSFREGNLVYWNESRFHAYIMQNEIILSRALTCNLVSILKKLHVII